MAGEKTRIYKDIPMESTGFARTIWDKDEKKPSAKTCHKFMNTNLMLQIQNLEGNAHVSVPLRSVPMLLGFYQNFLDELKKEGKHESKAKIPFWNGHKFLVLSGELAGNNSKIEFTIEIPEDSTKLTVPFVMEEGKADFDIKQTYDQDLVVAFQGMIKNLTSATSAGSAVLYELFEEIRKSKGGGSSRDKGDVYAGNDGWDD